MPTHGGIAVDTGGVVAGATGRGALLTSAPHCQCRHHGEGTAVNVGSMGGGSTAWGGGRCRRRRHREGIAVDASEE